MANFLYIILKCITTLKYIGIDRKIGKLYDSNIYEFLSVRKENIVETSGDERVKERLKDVIAKWFYFLFFLKKNPEKYGIDC